MATYVINEGISGAVSGEVITAEGFYTVGDFVDFTVYENGGNSIVYRVAAKSVVTIKRRDS